MTTAPVVAVFLGLAVMLGGVLPAEADMSLFSVNFYAFGRTNQGPDTEWNQEEWQKTVRVEDGKEAGVWNTSVWNNLGPSGAGFSGLITADDGISTATVTLNNQRNQSPYGWLQTRDPNTWVDGNASLLDAKIIGTCDLRDPPENPQDRRVDLTLSDIPFAIYDIILYFGINQAQYSWNAPGGLTNLRYNEQVTNDPDGLTGGIQFYTSDTDPATNMEPIGILRQIVNDGDPGNYILIQGLTGDFRAQVWGKHEPRGLGRLPAHADPRAGRVRAARRCHRRPAAEPSPQVSIRVLARFSAIR